MDVLVSTCAGLDVHQAVIVGCALIGQANGRVRKERAQFSSTAQGLAELAAWLRRHGVSHVGMEATGVYWMPVYAALEACGGFELIVANALHIKAVPGRKTDVKDAEWLADLVRHGLVRKSFIPDKPFRVLRDLLRYRRVLVDTQASERRRLISLLESADIKLASVLSDVFGVTGRMILRALIAGQQSIAAMANFARGRAREKRAALREALGATPQDHQRKLLALQLARVEAAEADMAKLDQEIDAHLKPYAVQMDLLVGIPGVDRVVAATIIAEIGVDLSSFPSAAQLCAWAGVCPGNNESGGKHKPVRARKGNPHLKTILCNAATGAARKKGSYFKSKYYKLKARLGGGKATLALAHKLLVAIYHILTNGTPYRDLGEHYLDTLNTQRTANRYIQRLKNLGFVVTIQAQPQQAAAL
jgi:transposase